MVDFKSIDDRTNLAGTNRLELLMFRLGDTLDAHRTALYGINVFKVRELMVLPPLTPLPGSHACLRGVASIRGKAVPVIDLNRYCGFDGGESSSILIITEFNNGTQGFLVNEVDDIVRLDWSDIDEPPELLAATHDNLLTAVSRLDEERMLLIVDVERVIAEVLGSPCDGGGTVAEVDAGRAAHRLLRRRLGRRPGPGGQDPRSHEPRPPIGEQRSRGARTAPGDGRRGRRAGGRAQGVAAGGHHRRGDAAHGRPTC